MQLFSHAELQTKQKQPDITLCGACKLYEHSTKMQPTGEGKRGILIIDSYPTKTEIRTNTTSAGVTEKYLRPLLKKYDVDFDKDCRRINVCQCYYKETRKVKKQLNPINNCRGYVWKEIENFKPKVIILLGDPALNSFLAHRWKKALDTVKKWRGYVIPDQDTKAYVIPTYHPSYLDELDKQSAVPVLFEEDIRRSVEALNLPTINEIDYRKQISILDNKRASTWLKSYYEECINHYTKTKKKRFFTFDYETTGLKPHDTRHYIYCCAITTDEGVTVSFLMDDENVKKILTEVLADGRIEKEAANMKFEWAWSYVKLGVEVQGFVWDTMQMAHYLDNRRGVTGLKFQAYVQFGIMDYDSHIHDYLVGTDSKNANSMNKIHLAPKEEILYYCGMDALVEYKLGMLQKKYYKRMKEVR